MQDAVARDVMTYDVVIVGAGPAGLAAAIQLKQLAQQANAEISVCVLEKGAAVGNHILSGAVFDPTALNALIPDWAVKHAPIHTPVTQDEICWLTANKHYRLPQWLVPPMIRNHGNFIISLGAVCSWLGEQAEALGVEIYAGYAAQSVIIENNQVMGVVTGDMGLDAQGQASNNFQAGIEIRALYTLIAEGARGSLTKQLEQTFALRQHAAHAKYGIGFKETWRIDPAKHRAGHVQHSLGWPLGNRIGGGGFVYQYAEDLVSVGMVVHLDYSNPYVSPYDEFQRFKTHPSVQPLLAGGTRLSYGARAIAAGGLQSLPRLIFPGGALIGCSAGMVNVAKIKGSHNAMQAGMLAAQAVFAALQGTRPPLLEHYVTQLQASWVWRDLAAARNLKPYLSRFGTALGSLLGGMELWTQTLGVRIPWTLKHQQADHAALTPAAKHTRIPYPKPDGMVSFDKLSSVALCNIGHAHDQPNHLHLAAPERAISINWTQYASPETRYCPAGVYEVVNQDQAPRLQINAQNCIHCKTCDIKDPTQNITWVPPEGGSGPNYVHQ